MQQVTFACPCRMSCMSMALTLLCILMQGVKMSDTQATSHGMVSAGLFFVISSAKPLQTLSAERPHTRIFGVYVFSSLMGQFIINTAYLIYMYSCAIAMMDPVRPFAMMIRARLAFPREMGRWKLVSRSSTDSSLGSRLLTCIYQCRSSCLLRS